MCVGVGGVCLEQLEEPLAVFFVCLLLLFFVSELLAHSCSFVCRCLVIQISGFVLKDN